MPTLKNLNNARIQMFADDHPPPHFRLHGPNSDAQIALASQDVIAGRADRRDLKEAPAWARQNRTGLLTGWSRLNERD